VRRAALSPFITNILARRPYRCGNYLPSFPLKNDQVQEVIMTKQFLAGAMAIALATGLTSSAMAFGHGGSGGFHGGGFHGGAGFGGSHGGGFRTGLGGFRGSYAALPRSNFAGVRGFTSFRYGGWGGQRFVRGYGGWGYGGPYYYDDGLGIGLGLVGLGLGLATGYPYCSPFSYRDYYGYCGPNYVVAW
jgi:hypothetical protein